MVLRFLQLLMHNVGSPVQIALAALALFYGVAWLRGLAAAEMGLLACAALACVVGRGTVDWQTLTTIQPWPLGVLVRCNCRWDCGVGRLGERRSASWPVSQPSG